MIMKPTFSLTDCDKKKIQMFKLKKKVASYIQQIKCKNPKKSCMQL